jgi:hypothetical protein
MWRAGASIFIGAVLALLLAFASQFVLVPLTGGALRPLTTAMFWLVFLAVFGYVVIVVARGRR